MEEVNKPNLVIVVTNLRLYIISLGRLRNDIVPPRTHLTVQRQVFP